MVAAAGAPAAAGWSWKETRKKKKCADPNDGMGWDGMNVK